MVGTYYRFPESYTTKLKICVSCIIKREFMSETVSLFEVLV